MLTEARRFREPHVVTHGRPDGTRKVALQLFEDLSALAHPTVVERRDYAPYEQILSVTLHLIYASEEVAYPLQRQYLHRDRDQELLDVEEAIDVENIPRRRRVQQYEVVALEVLEGFAQHQLGD